MRTLINNANLIDGCGNELIPNAAVMVEDDHIAYAGPAAACDTTASDHVIDAAGRTILPGIIDAHVHVSMQFAALAEQLQTPFSLRYYKAAEYLKTTLHAGITSVRDALGSDRGIKQAVEEGYIVGPRMMLSINALTITGGHGDGYRISGDILDLNPSGYPGMPDGRCDGVPEVRKKVREMLRAGAEVIKVHATGGVSSPTDHPQFTQFSYEELRVMVEEAAFRGGTKVMAHAQGNEGIKNAVRAGVHSIEHGIYLDDEAIDMMLEKGTFLVPTLLAPVAVLENADAIGLSQNIIDKAKETLEAHAASIAKAHAAGVKIAMGTDAGVFPHGINLRELRLMVDIGMSPMQAIVAATKTAAECMGWDDRVGTLESGKLADLILYDGNPLDDIDGMANTDRISMVMKNGRLEKNLPTSPR